MSDRIKNKIGDELYNQILAKGIKAEEFDLINDGSYIPRSRFNELNDNIKIEKEKVTTLETKIGEMSKLVSGNEELKTKYLELDSKYKNEIMIKDKIILNNSKKYLVESALNKEGAKYTDLLLGKIDFEKLTIEGSNILGLSDIVKDLKTNYKELFVEKQTNTNDKNKTKKENDFESILGLGKLGSDTSIDWDTVGKKL